MVISSSNPIEVQISEDVDKFSVWLTAVGEGGNKYTMSMSMYRGVCLGLAGDRRIFLRM